MGRVHLLVSRSVDQAVLDDTSRHLRAFIPQWRDEFPMRIHDRGFAEDGSHQWSGEFSRWITRSSRRRDDEDHPDTRLRLTRLMRRLREVAPREHDVLWMILRGDRVQDVCTWLNARAIRQGHPERYSLKDTVVLIVSGVDKLAYWS